MREHTHAGMSLYGSAGSRKYLNAAERRRFAKAALRTPLEVQLFCIVLSLTGGRVSEILAVTPAAIDIDGIAISIDFQVVDGEIIDAGGKDGEMSAVEY